MTILWGSRVNQIIRLILYSILTIVAVAWAKTYFPRPYVEKNLPAYGTREFGYIKKYEAIVQLKKDYKMCSAVVIDDNYILTAAHCVSDWPKHYDGPIEIFDRHGVQTDSYVHVVGFYPDYDVALLRGDLTEFDSLEIDAYEGPKFGNLYQTCGFPSLQNKLTCTNYVPTQNFYFLLSGSGFIIRGMSGGPVVDPVSRKVIGVNSAVYGNQVLVAPTLGILGIFKIEGVQ